MKTMEHRRPMFAVGTDRDSHSPFDSSGAIVAETSLCHSHLEDALKRAETIGDLYGERYIFQLVPIGTYEDVKRRHDSIQAEFDQQYREARHAAHKRLLSIAGGDA